MILLFGKYRITSYTYGYKISKQKGKLWSILSYHDTLEDAFNTLLEHRVRVDTIDFVVDFLDANNFQAQKDSLLAEIKKMKSEMEEAYAGRSK